MIDAHTRHRLDCQAAGIRFVYKFGTQPKIEMNTGCGCFIDHFGKDCLGHGRRIGQAIATPFADAGAEIAVNYKENKWTAHELVSAASRQKQVADIGVMLARNGYITGQSINVDGGRYPTS